MNQSLTSKFINISTSILVSAIFITLSSSVFAAKSPSALFEYVDTLPNLELKLQESKAAHKPVMVEFFATWCPICKRVDKEILSDSNIQQSMRAFNTFRIDVSERTPDVASIMQKYHVYAVPTVIFFNKNGDMIDANKVRHGVNKQKLMGMLSALA